MNTLTKKAPDVLNSKKVQAFNEVMAGGPSVKPSKRHRKAERLIVPLERQSCHLKVGDHILPASLVNESRGGFAVWTDRVDCLKIGETIGLHTDQGWFPVRIVYFREVAKSQDTQVNGDSWFQLGLRKTGKLSNLIDPTARSLNKMASVPSPEKEEKRSLKTKRKIEAVIAEEISCFEQEYMGMKPREVSVYLMGDLLVVRFLGIFSEVKQPLTILFSAEKQQEFLKELKELQVYILEATRSILEAIVEKITGVKVQTTQHDFNIATGEKVIFFTLSRSPDCLE
jgi:uncharacterized protein YbcI